jgi:hypothetical protein
MTEPFGHLLSKPKIKIQPKSASRRLETNRAARLGDVDALPFSMGFGECAMLVGGRIRRQDSGRLGNG